MSLRAGSGAPPAQASAAAFRLRSVSSMPARLWLARSATPLTGLPMN